MTLCLHQIQLFGLDRLVRVLQLLGEFLDLVLVEDRSLFGVHACLDHAVSLIRVDLFLLDQFGREALDFLLERLFTVLIHLDTCQEV